MDSINEALDDSKLDEPSNVNIIEDWESLIKMHFQPFFDRPGCAKRRE
jgi:hypothetical protein